MIIYIVARQEYYKSIHQINENHNLIIDQLETIIFNYFKLLKSNLIIYFLISQNLFYIIDKYSKILE